VRNAKFRRIEEDRVEGEIATGVCRSLAVHHVGLHASASARVRCVDCLDAGT
jgi:hypothetical protein